MVSAPEDSDIMLITSDGVVIRMHVDEISIYGRQTQGVRLMKLSDGVKTVSVALTEREEEEDEVTSETEDTETPDSDENGGEE